MTSIFVSTLSSLATLTARVDAVTSNVATLTANSISLATVDAKISQQVNSASVALGAVILSESQRAIAAESALNNSLGLHSTTSQMNLAIATALGSYTNTAGVNAAISAALVPYDTISLRISALTSYSTTASMNSAISAAIAPLATNASVTGLFTMVTAISTGLATEESRAMAAEAQGGGRVTFLPNTTCNATASGLLRYNTLTSNLEVCNASNWIVGYGFSSFFKNGVLRQGLSRYCGRG